MLLETKVIISYVVVCITYSMCRLHYLLTLKNDEDFNSMLEELIDVSGSKDIVKLLVVMQIIFSPITAPFSILKQVYRVTKKFIIKP